MNAPSKWPHCTTNGCNCQAQQATLSKSNGAVQTLSVTVSETPDCRTGLGLVDFPLSVSLRKWGGGGGSQRLSDLSRATHSVRTQVYYFFLQCPLWLHDSQHGPQTSSLKSTWKPLRNTVWGPGSPMESGLNVAQDPRVRGMHIRVGEASLCLALPLCTDGGGFSPEDLCSLWQLTTALPLSLRNAFTGAQLTTSGEKPRPTDQQVS